MLKINSSTPLTIRSADSGTLKMGADQFYLNNLVWDAGTYTYTGSNGSAVSAQNLTINGGTVTSQTYNLIRLDNSTFTMNDGTIASYNAVVVSNDSTGSSIFTMDGGTINGKVSIGGGTNSGNSSNNVFVMNNGTINSGNDDAVGIGLNSTFTLNGGDIICSYLYAYALDIAYTGSRIELNGGTITHSGGDSAVNIPPADFDGITLGGAVIRALVEELFVYYDSDYKPWLPAGCNSVLNSADNYYYLTRQ